ncbi:NAD(P)/FAD-dependent oxidoreductase [Dactylosporangium matsuzakiense]|uniref:FAD-binding monooxygenase n=1 Tax=Dactylosporangium matsuzakiense TaxID=53360 RepID=A0A9W6NSM9_9ACTN|nr:FAD-binding monooxygenase [Dactylosporangium matsuzakiense]UWZ49068.1 FAD-binding monooxygenase [Dactylosporangium matsuzakiense]GLL07496.1 FAD-binding monooxygenase [Dactylosporangium matsuzakiense]
MKQNAVVLGGGVAGLLAAAALAPRYDIIEIIERDDLPEGPEARRGAPQGRHVHAMLPRGLQAIERLLPGTTDRLTEAGGMRGDVLGNARWYLNGLLLRQSDLGLTAITASRPLIEHTIRAAVRALPNIVLRDGHDIIGLDPGRGVQVTDRHGGGSRVIPASLVVDATGRASRMPQWLAAFGCAPPPEDAVPIDLRYASRVFEDPGGDLLGDDLVVITARYPGRRRSSVMQRLEHNRVLVTLAGVHGERPPGDLEGFTEYAGSLSVPDTAKVVAAGHPVGDAVTYHFPAYVRRRYERVELPPGLLVIGDAACAFNPVYGQGMSTAAMSAELLLDDVDPQHFHAAQAQLHEAPWTLAVGADLALDGVPLDDNAKAPAELVRRLQLAAAEDAELAAAFIRVTSLVDSPRALAEPWIAERLTR